MLALKAVKSFSVKSFRGVVLLALGLALLFAETGAVSKTRAAAVERPVVVELFTSQGCNSCPPAEAFLNKLAKRDDVIALEFHVDYWDYIGWKDPFASPDYTERQKNYADSLDMSYVYTPQMVINGRRDEVGSRVMSIEVAIDEEKNKPPEIIPTIYVEPEYAAQGTDQLSIRIESNGIKADTDYDVVVISYDEHRETKVTRGENRGKTLVSSNIVRDMRVVGTWAGGDMELTAPIYDLAGKGGCVVLLQEHGVGPILTAVKLPLS